MAPYAPVAIFVAVAFAAALGFSLLPGLLAQRKPNPEKRGPYPFR
jgi:NADH:ubiquinone oxidoreductase subunit 3 (subunit A)